MAGSPTASVLASSDGLERATVTFDYEAEDETNITIKVGGVVIVTDKSDADWWEWSTFWMNRRSGCTRETTSDCWTASRNSATKAIP